VDCVELCSWDFDLFVGTKNKIAIDVTRAITAASLFGIDRWIAYANRKYHSRWMRTGVNEGFAGVKLSGSIKMCGSYRVSTVNVIIVIAITKMSVTL